MTESEFLYGEALSDRIKAVCAGDDVRCAVAFLGRHIKEALFPAGTEQVQIMCDLSMNCTSKRALHEFGAPSSGRTSGNDNLRVRNGLHGKVYISSFGIVIGSPNMSTRGLGRELKGDWNLETGTFSPSGSGTWEQASSWFDEEFAQCHPVSSKDVKDAPDDSRDPGRPASKVEVRGLSLLERIENYTADFADVLFVFTDVDLPKKEEDRLLHKEGLLTSDSTEVVVWDKASARVNHSGTIVGFHLPETGGNWRVDGYIESHPSGKQSGLLLFGINRWAAVKRIVGQPDLPKRLTSNDIVKLDQLSSGGAITLTADRLADAIRTIGSSVP